MRTCFLPEVGNNPVEIVKEEWNKKNEEWEKIKDRLLGGGSWFENVIIFSRIPFKQKYFRLENIICSGFEIPLFLQRTSNFIRQPRAQTVLSFTQVLWIVVPNGLEGEEEEYIKGLESTRLRTLCWMPYVGFLSIGSSSSVQKYPSLYWRDRAAA